MLDGVKNDFHSLNMGSLEGALQVDASDGDDVLILGVNDLDANQVVQVTTNSNNFKLQDDTNDFTGLNFEYLRVDKVAGQDLMVDVDLAASGSALGTIGVSNPDSMTEIVSWAGSAASHTVDIAQGAITNTASGKSINTFGFDQYMGGTGNDTYLLNADGAKVTDTGGNSMVEYSAIGNAEIEFLNGGDVDVMVPSESDGVLTLTGNSVNSLELYVEPDPIATGYRLDLTNSTFTIEGNATTVDWVVLTAAVVGLAVAAYSAVPTTTNSISCN